MVDKFGTVIKENDYIVDFFYLNLYINNKYISFSEFNHNNYIVDFYYSNYIKNNNISFSEFNNKYFFEQNRVIDFNNSVVIGNLNDLKVDLSGTGKDVIKLFHNKIKPFSLIVYLTFNHEPDLLVGMYIGKNKVLTSTGRISTLNEGSMYFPILCKTPYYVEQEKLFKEIYQSLGLKSGNKASNTTIGSCVYNTTGVYVYIGEYTLSLNTTVRIELNNNFIGKKKYYVRIADNVADVFSKLSVNDKLYTSEIKQIIEEGSIKLGDCYTSQTALYNLISLGEQTEGVGGYGSTIDTLSFGTLEAFKRVSTFSKSFNIIDDINFNEVTFFSGLVKVNFV